MNPVKAFSPLLFMSDEFETHLTKEYSTHDLFAMCDLNESATEKEIKTKTEGIIVSYLELRNSDRANLFQEIQRRLLASARSVDQTTPEHHIESRPVRVGKRSQFVSIHSQFRSNYYGDDSTSTKFHFSLPDVIKTHSVRVVAVEIPRMYNTISTAIGNSSMVAYHSADDATAWRITIPDGNYDVLTKADGCFADGVNKINEAIATAMKGTIDAAGKFEEVEQDTSLPLIYSVDELTQKSTFTSSDKSIDTIRFNVDADGSVDASKVEKFGLGPALGFRYGERTFATDGTLTSEGGTFLSGPRYWFISIDDMLTTPHSTPFLVAYSGWSSTNNILSRVDLAENSEYRIIRSHLSQARIYNGTGDIQNLHIRLLDEYGQQVDLNDMDWSLVLEFETPEVGWETQINNGIEL